MVIPAEVKPRISTLSGNSTSRPIPPKEPRAGIQDLCTLLFRATLLTVAKRWKQPVSADSKWINGDAT